MNHEPHKWKDTKWVWRSVGNVQHEGRRAEARTCLGVIKCNNCSRLVRPRTQSAARQLQLDNECHACGTHSLRHDPCNARTYHFTVEREEQMWSIWEHTGQHDTHDRPPGGGLSRAQEEAVDEQVLRRTQAGAHQLRTGDLAPGSVPLPQISATLANPRTARYELGKSQARLGLQASPMKGALSMLHSFGELSKKFETPFIVDSCLHGPIYITMQTPFMAQMLDEAVDSWIEDAEDGPEAGRHGFVTDGDHSYFRQGPLLATCAFNKVLNAWVPVLYTWIDGLDTEHHRPHFHRIFAAVVEHAGSRFAASLLTHVRIAYHLACSTLTMFLGHGFFCSTTQGRRIC